MRRLLILAVCVVGAWGCEDTAAGGGDAALDLDASSVDATILDPKDAGPDAPTQGQFGDPCEENRDCFSRFCIEGPQGTGRICTKACGECPAGFECNPIANDGPDRTFVCLFDQPDLCNPCETDRDCDDNPDLCLQIGNSRYCAEDCSDDGVCPDGYECIDVEGDGDAGVFAQQCVPAGGEGCQPCRDEDGDGYGDGGDCLGFDCRDDNPDVYEGAPELCDGVDNNCNSLVDEPELLGPPPEETVCLSAGVCAGTRVSCLSGTWQCDYPSSYEEGVETLCDGLDNECDGAQDDDIDLTSDPANCAFCNNACTFAHAAGICLDSSCELGDCEAGWFNVDGNDGNGCEYNCNETQDGVEACDSIDNDCDGATDEAFELETDAANCGGCNRVCDLANALPACVVGECEISECQMGWVDRDDDASNGCEFECERSNDGVEICDTLDNDCDGLTDEGFDLEGLEHCGGCNQPCGFDNGDAACDGGECALVACSPGFFDPNMETADGCEYSCVVSRDGIEACDTIDNDCDGAVDESFDLASDAMNCGGCGRNCFFANAVPTCVDSGCEQGDCLDGFWDVDDNSLNGCEYACNLSNAGEELCDAADNDCDGSTDEDFDVLSDTNHCGRCNNACVLDNADPRCGGGNCLIAECDGGFADIDGDPSNGCEYACQPTNGGIEACDNIDNDCDGGTDEDFDTQSDVEHCGGCGDACGAANGTVECDGGACAFTGCDAGFYDIDGRPENGCEYACDREGPIDLPDPLGIDANCDGIDGNANAAVFVDAGVGGPNGAGTRESPLDSVNAGIALAVNAGFSQVIVGQGSYDETVTVVSNINLFGGYNAVDQWSRNIEAFESRINGQPMGLRAENINSATTVQGFTITGANAIGAGQSSYAVYARDVANGALILANNLIIAGNGADGADGNNGSGGSSAQSGGGGGTGCDGCNGGGNGGAGGPSACRPGGAGGRGGYDRAASAGGGNGAGGNGGPGGSGVGSGCTNAGRNGGNGGNGGPGSNASGGNGSGVVAGSLWLGNPGQAGFTGVHGGGRRWRLGWRRHDRLYKLRRSV